MVRKLISFAILASLAAGLVHPSPGYKEDEGVGLAALSTSNFLPSNLVINFT